MKHHGGKSHQLTTVLQNSNFYSSVFLLKDPQQRSKRLTYDLSYDISVLLKNCFIEISAKACKAIFVLFLYILWSHYIFFIYMIK